MRVLGHSLLKKILLLGCSGLFALLAAEIFCAVLMPTEASGTIKRDLFGRSFTEVEKGSDGFGESLPDGLSDLRRNLSTDFESRVASYSIQTNSIRLRDPREFPASDAEEFRILTLGDSQTFGMGLDREETFSFLLEQQFRSSGSDQVRILNAGVPGYGTYEALEKARRVVPETNPNLVILFLHIHDGITGMTGNDLDDNLRRLNSLRKEQAKPKTQASGQANATPAPAAIGTPHEPVPRRLWDWLVNHSHLCATASMAKQALQGNTQ